MQTLQRIQINIYKHSQEKRIRVKKVLEILSIARMY